MEYLIIISIICVIVAVICIIKLQNKQRLDKTEKNKLEREVQLLKHNKDTLREDLQFCQEQIEKEQKRFQHITEEDNRILAQKAAELDEFYDKGKARRLEQLENEIARQETAAKELLKKNLENETTKYNEQTLQLKQAYQSVVEEYDMRSKQIVKDTEFQQERFNSLLAPLHQYEKEKMAKLFYTIQVPDEYKKDIEFLLANVAPKIQHPDIVNKLVWAEYVKPYLDETFKRVGIEPKPGIYKITNIDDGKCYIGKSTDIKKRLTDHFKSSIGISSISDQAVHHAILEQGFWNWSIEPIIYCEKEQLSELEKYYIEFFKAQIHGYNKNSGGGG